MIYSITPVKIQVTDDELIKAYNALRSVWKVGKELGISGQTAHERLKKLGIKMNGSGERWLKKDDDDLIALYQAGFERGDGVLSEFCKSKNRTNPFVSRQARRLGLSDITRTACEKQKRGCSIRASKRIKENGHPRGMAGKRHSKETIDRISEASKNMWLNMSEEKKDDYSKRASINGAKCAAKNREKASWNAGWRDIGGVEKYYRSRWEANYARYLEYLRVNGHIQKWEHEPETFWFDGIKRGCMSYLPDFRITENNNEIVYHEVKGWMDDRSKTKIKRMGIYFNDVKLIVIQSKEYNEIKKKMSRIIPGWE